MHRRLLFFNMYYSISNAELTVQNSFIGSIMLKLTYVDNDAIKPQAGVLKEMGGAKFRKSVIS